MFSRTYSRALSIGQKLALLTASAILGVAGLTAVFLVSERTLLLEERQAGVRQVVEGAHGLLAHYHALQVEGALSEAQAKERAIQALRGLRYSGNEYFWINDMQPRMVMHPITPALEGQDLAGHNDATGKPLFQAAVDVVKAEGAGFVAYRWAKPGSSQPMPKISYVMGFAPWGWIVGSGVYVDTVYATLMERIVGLSICALALAAVLLLIGWTISRGLLKQIGGDPLATAHIARRIAEGDLAVEIELRRGDQESLLHAIQGMRDSLAKLTVEVRQERTASLLTSLGTFRLAGDGGAPAGAASKTQPPGRAAHDAALPRRAAMANATSGQWPEF